MQYAMGCDVNTARTDGFAAATALAAQADVTIAVMGIMTCQEEG